MWFDAKAYVHGQHQVDVTIIKGENTKYKAIIHLFHNPKSTITNSKKHPFFVEERKDERPCSREDDGSLFIVFSLI